MFDEILNSSNASDALLGEQIDKLAENVNRNIWTSIDIFDASKDAKFSSSTMVRLYVNKYLKRCILRFQITCNNAITSGVGFSNKVDVAYTPMEGLEDYRIKSGYTSDVYVTAAGTVGISAASGTIPASTKISGQISWDIPIK